MLRGLPPEALEYKPKGAVPADKFQAAYAKAPDDRGYIFSVNGAAWWITADTAGSVVPYAVEDGRPLKWGNGRAALEPPPGGDKTNNTASGVAYAGGKVYVSWEKRNRLGVYDAKSGDLKETWPVNGPRRLAVRSDGVVVVISEGRVLRVRSTDFSRLSQPPPEPLPTKVGTTNVIDSPSSVALDSDGNIYVANCGALQNVSVFNRDGKYLRSIGQPGGRPTRGRYDPTGMYMPGGIAVDKQDKLWVAETTDSPKRFSVWDAKTSSFVKEFFGSANYFGWACMDPKKPDEIYCHNVLWK
ncbi:MAG: hypothetical protein HY646_05690, partial [Acidobacteria bacterium]|nr:hypothetical protein [Acidobacteriota bacterium]